MKKLKKLALWLMMMVLVFSLSACGEKEDDDSKSDRKDRVEEREDDDEDDKDSKEDEEKDDEKSEDDEKESESKEEDGETKAKDEEPEESKEDSDKDVEETVTDTVDAEFLLNKLYEMAESNNVMTQVTTNMEIEMSMAMEGFSMDIDMVSSGKNMIQVNPYLAYTYTEMTVNLLGEKETVVSENYILAENGSLVSYAYDGSTDSWTKMDTGMSETEIMEQAAGNYYWLIEKPASDFTVDTQLYNIGGRDAYKIEFTLTGEEMNQTLNGMTGVTDMLEESGMGDMLDMSSLNVPAIYYIDAETYQIVQMEMNIEGMGDMMNNMMSSILGADPTTAGYQMDFNIGKCYAVYSDISYEPVEIPALPAEATETTDVINIEDLDIRDTDTTQVQPEDGVYTIEESGAVAKVTCPEGWTVLESAYDQLYIENEETWQEAEFVMYVDVTREDFVSVVEEMIVPELQTYNVYISHGMGQEIGAFETMEVLGDGLNFYFAWAPVDNGWIMVTVTDYDGLSLEEALVPILDLVDLGNVL